MTDNKQVATLEQRARERVREVFAGILTDQELDQHIKREFDAFFNQPAESAKIISKRRQEGYGLSAQYVTEFTELKATPLRMIVWEFLSTMVLEWLKQNMDSSELDVSAQYESAQSTDPNTGMPTNLNAIKYNLGEELQKRCEKMAQEQSHLFFQNIFAGMMSMSKQDMMNELSDRLGNNQY